MSTALTVDVGYSVNVEDWEPGDPLYGGPGVYQRQYMITEKSDFFNEHTPDVIGADGARWTPKDGWRSVH